MKNPDYLTSMAAVVSHCDRRILEISDLIRLLETTDTAGFSPDEAGRHIEALQQVREMKEFYLKLRTQFAALAEDSRS